MKDKSQLIFLLWLIFSAKEGWLLYLMLPMPFQPEVYDNKKGKGRRKKTILSNLYRIPLTPELYTFTVLVGFESYMQLRDGLNFHEQLRYEWGRLETFNSAPSTLQATISAIRLARDGFYYTGEGLGCKCAYCGFRYSNWEQRDNPKDVHFRLKPNCPFIRFGDVVNIPIHDSGQRMTPTFSTGVNGQAAVMSRNGHVSSYQPSDHPAIEQPFLVYNFVNKLTKIYNERIENLRNQIEHIKSQTTNDNVRSAQRRNIESEIINEQSVQNESQTTKDIRSAQERIPKYPDKVSFQNRLWTYRNFPNKGTPTPNDLAQAGFFYKGWADNVHCFSCGLGLRNWKFDDNPWVEHARWFPKCKYLRHEKGDEFVNEVQRVIKKGILQSIELEITNDTEQSVGERTQRILESIESKMTNDREQSVQEKKHIPKYPGMTLFTERLQTYHNFPKATPTPDTLTHAGFFYTGNSDLVRCFDCGGGLECFESSDDPWVEHAHFYPECKYLRQQKGDTFVNKMQNRIKDNKPSIQHNIMLSFQSSEVFTGKKKLCKVCNDAAIDTICLPCYHQMYCIKSTTLVQICHQCKENVNCFVKL